MAPMRTPMVALCARTSLRYREALNFGMQTIFAPSRSAARKVHTGLGTACAAGCF